MGSFTEVLAPHASDVLALDVSQSAVAQVADRLREHAHVRTAAMAIPAEFPQETFDLVVASDVLYYLSVNELRLCLSKIEAALAPGGAFAPCTTSHGWGASSTATRPTTPSLRTPR